jgi:two-component system, OmpR family, sensor histidine kinase CiaH
MFKKLQLKMALYFTLILIGILILSSTGIYLTLSSYNTNQLSREINEMLNSVSESSWTAEAKEESVTENDDNKSSEIKLSNGKDIVIPKTLASFSFYFIYDNKGNLITSKNDNSKEYNEVLKISNNLKSGGNPTLYTIKGNPDLYYLLVKRPIIINKAYIGDYCIGRDVSSAYETMDNLMKIIFFSLIAGSVISLLLGFVIAGETIKPIKRAYLSKERFAADASHELRTPISIIQLSAEALDNELDDKNEFVQQVISDIKDETIRMGELVENLLFLARNDSGRLNVQWEHIDFSKLLGKTVNSFKMLAKDKDITIESEISTDLFIDGDKKLLKSLIVILIDNAIKYSHVGGIVKVSACQQENKKGSNLIFKVEDNGIGIAKDKVENIFERFYRLETSRSKQIPGYGLGLSIAKEIVTIHHGSIKVTSEEGSGSCFIFTLKQTRPASASLRPFS